MSVASSKRSTTQVRTGELQAFRRNELYRQANAIGRSAQGLELFEKRLIVLALSCIDHASEKPSLEAVIPLRAFEEHGIENPYDRAKRAAEALPSRIVIIPRDDGGFDAYPWLQRLSYVPVEDSDLGYSYIRVVFNEELRPWITNLRSHYAVLPIHDVLQMPSMFAARLYEVLWHVSMAGRRPAIEVELMELKFALGLVERDKRGAWVRERYKDWRDFRKQLQVALRAFKKHGSLVATFKGVRVGRKIGKVHFHVEVVKPIPHLGIQPALFEGDASPEQQRLTERLRNIGFTGNAAKLIEEHSAPVVEAAIAITERKQKEGVLNRPGGFLRAILKDGTARQEALAREVRKSPNNERASANDSDEDAWLEAWEAHRRKVADDIQADEKLEREQVVTLVREALGSQPAAKLILSMLERNEWQGPAFETYRTKVLLERFQARAPASALDIEAFQESHAS